MAKKTKRGRKQIKGAPVYATDLKTGKIVLVGYDNGKRINLTNRGHRLLHRT